MRKKQNKEKTSSWLFRGHNHIWILCMVLILLLFGSNTLTPKAQGPLDVIPTDPFEAPSAAAELYLLRQAGVLPELKAAPESPMKVPLLFTGLYSGQPGVDVIVNNPGADTPENTTQSETSLAVNGNTICAGYNNSGPGGFSGLSRSTDLGATWTDLGGIGQSGDPVIAVHEGTGTFYYAELATIGGQSAIGVARSTDDCQSFGAPIDASPVASGLATTTFNDKPWIAVDNTGGTYDGNIYVCWTRFATTGSELRVSRSTDGGLTYGNEQIVGPAGNAPFGCSVGVGPAGQVYISWADRTGATTAGDIQLRSSTDGGVTYNPMVTVSTNNRAPGTDRVVNCLDFNRTTLTGDIRMLHQSWLAVDTSGGPYDGNIYIVWASDPNGTPDNSDAFFSRSTDGGATWSAPVQLGAGGGATDQFEPFVAVNSAGAVSIAWYDRRNDVANNTNIDVFKTFSTDGGATLDPIIRVTDVSFPVPPILPNFDPGVRSCYMGEYIAIASDATNFYYFWGDNRNTLFTTNYPAPNGRPDPDVFFDFQPAPLMHATINVVKQVDAQPDGVFDDDPAGWTFDVFDDGEPVQTTDSSGILTFVVQSGSYDVKEVSQPASDTGLWLVTASCEDDSDNTPVGMGATDVLFGPLLPDVVVDDLDLVAGQSVTCTFDNQKMAGFVTGGGHIQKNKGKNALRISFGGNMGVAHDGSFHGQWQTNFHNVNNDFLSGNHYHSTNIDSILFGTVEGEEPDPPDAVFNSIEFVTTGRLDGQVCQLTVVATDHGEPARGKNKGEDSDSIQFILDCPDDAYDYDSANDFSKDEGDLHNLDGGNLQIHSPRQ